MGNACGRAEIDSSFGIQLTVADAPNADIGGRIECHFTGETQPIHVEWISLETECAALLTLNDDRTVASKVPPGQYRVVAVDHVGSRAIGLATVRTESTPCVVGYDVVHATSDTARDGSITAVIERLDASSEIRYLWTNGVVTCEPSLQDARPGLYVVTPMYADGVVAMPFQHTCVPAQVRPTRRPQQLAASNGNMASFEVEASSSYSNLPS